MTALCSSWETGPALPSSTIWNFPSSGKFQWPSLLLINLTIMLKNASEVGFGLFCLGAESSEIGRVSPLGEIMPLYSHFF